MLLELSIKNFAIINKLTVSFTKGLNIITGETGTGKSIIIEALSQVLGERATKDYVRTGANKAVIEALFYLDKNQSEVITILNDFGIDMEKDNTLLLIREIYASGRSTSRVNGRTVTISMLSKLTSKLIDIHGQHQHQSLLNKANHIDIIDSLGNEDLVRLKEKIKLEFNELQRLKNKLKEFNQNDMERERQIDLLKFQIEEIDGAKLNIGEDKELIEEYNIISNKEEIVNTLGEIKEILGSENYNNRSVLDEINYCITLISKISKYNNDVKNFEEIIKSLSYQIQDLLRDLRHFYESLEYDRERLAFLENRIDIINRLKRKYGGSIEEILEYKDRLCKEMEYLENSKEEISKINKNIKNSEEKLKIFCSKLTEARRKIAKHVENKITQELSDLNMKHIKFKVRFDRTEYFTSSGWDKIEFLISTNLGEDLKPLSKITSGGEMSRIMLAFKNILADVDNISCLVFDEIDSGISGRTAQIVGEKIKKISKTHQIISITHLPQIASMADTHFLIEKTIIDNNTITSVKKLNYEERVDELSRLLGGAKLTETTKLHAKEMLDINK